MLGLASSYAQWPAWAAAIAGLGVILVLIDLACRRKDAFSAIVLYAGLLAGSALACLIGLAAQAASALRHGSCGSPGRVGDCAFFF